MHKVSSEKQGRVMTICCTGADCALNWPLSDDHSSTLPRLTNQHLAVFPEGSPDHFPAREGNCTGRGGGRRR